MVCRFGGEEFVIIMPTCSSGEAASKAEKICKGVRERVRVPYRDAILSVTISMGVASSPAHGSTLNDVVKAADNALYEAKQEGRDRVAVAPVEVPEEI